MTEKDKEIQELRRKLEKIEVVDMGLFDIEEIHENCTVQILKNSITGGISIGWWEN